MRTQSKEIIQNVSKALATRMFTTSLAVGRGSPTLPETHTLAQIPSHQKYHSLGKVLAFPTGEGQEL